MKVLLLDVCHTLYKANTTFGLLDLFLKDDPRYQQLSARRRSFSSRVKSLFSGADQARQEAISLLAGQTEQNLKSSAESFVDLLVPIRETHEYLETQRKDGAKIVLLSASIDLVVNIIGERLGVDEVFSSPLGFKDGICLGELRQDLSGNKHTIIQRHFDSETSEFVTDNYDDAPCGELVDQFRPVYRRSDFRARVYWSLRSTDKPITYA